jgi:hypothetical protein
MGRQHKDPDDVFLNARNREREIKEQIKGLQKMLNRKHSKRKGFRAKKHSE